LLVVIDSVGALILFWFGEFCIDGISSYWIMLFEFNGLLSSLCSLLFFLFDTNKLLFF